MELSYILIFTKREAPLLFLSKSGYYLIARFFLKYLLAPAALFFVFYIYFLHKTILTLLLKLFIMY